MLSQRSNRPTVRRAIMQTAKILLIVFPFAVFGGIVKVGLREFLRFTPDAKQYSVACFLSLLCLGAVSFVISMIPRTPLK